MLLCIINELAISYKLMEMRANEKRERGKDGERDRSLSATGTRPKLTRPRSPKRKKEPRKGRKEEKKEGK